MNNVFLGIGSNLGDRKKNIAKAVNLISEHKEITFLKCSSIYETPPVGYEKQEFFLNCVLKIKTTLDVHKLLFVTQLVEIEIGRKKTFKWGPRVIDIDILFFNQDTVNNKDLVVPHPYLSKRGFVLLPFSEIEKDFLHPILNKTIEELLRDLPKNSVENIKKIN